MNERLAHSAVGGWGVLREVLREASLVRNKVKGPDCALDYTSYRPMKESKIDFSRLSSLQLPRFVMRCGLRRCGLSARQFQFFCE